MLTLNEQIRAARVKLTLTQKELGQLLGLSQARIAQIEKPGQNMTLETATKVVRAVGLELRWMTLDGRPWRRKRCRLRSR